MELGLQTLQTCFVGSKASSQKYAHGEELTGFKEGVGVFSSIVMKICPLHMQLAVALFLSHAVILQCLFCHVLVYVIGASVSEPHTGVH